MKYCEKLQKIPKYKDMNAPLCYVTPTFPVFLYFLSTISVSFFLSFFLSFFASWIHSHKFFFFVRIVYVSTQRNTQSKITNPFLSKSYDGSLDYQGSIRHRTDSFTIYWPLKTFLINLGIRPQSVTLSYQSTEFPATEKAQNWRKDIRSLVVWARSQWGWFWLLYTVLS